MGSLLLASDYIPKKVEVLPVESYPARASVKDITIAADPYPDNEKSATAFDCTDLNSRGFFPVHLIIRNNSPYYLKVRTQNIQLETRLGERLYSTPATIVVEEVVGKKFSDSFSGLKDGDTLSDSIASPLSDFTSKALTNGLINPGMTRDGFLFFYTEKNKRSIFMGSTLIIPALREEGTNKVFGPFTIPLDPALKTQTDTQEQNVPPPGN